MKGYESDPYFGKIRKEICEEENWIMPSLLLFSEDDNGLLFFEDWNGNIRLYIPKSQQVEIMSKTHNTVTEAAHAVYHKTYNKIAGVYC